MKYVITIFTILISIANGAITAKCLSKSEKSSLEFIQCSFCDTPRFVYVANARARKNVCENGDPPNLPTVARAVLDYLTVQGHFWRIESDALGSMEHLIEHMPVRDALLLFGNGGDTFLNFIAEHIQLALLVRYDGPSWTRSIPQDIYRDYVLPYAFLNEKRDVDFRWRSRFFKLFYPLISKANPTTQAMHILTDAIPLAAASGVLEYNNTVVPGYVVQWKSETSPMRLSPENVIELGGGSCTGTAITLAAAARSVGIPIRLAGCSQSIQDDDHHWTEFYDKNDPGPFQDFWHSKEGTSKGNEGGPWDSPSAPMNTCLKYLVPRDPTGLNTIWVSQWSSNVTMPLQWGPRITTTSGWLNGSSVSGLNRCGAYCSAWGCGSNQTNRYKQSDCW